jgi:hypothetical protein
MLSKVLMKFRIISFLLFINIILVSCRKPDEYPIIPAITFKSISTTQDAQGLDVKMTVLIDFTDGDGDVGYKEVGMNDPIFDDPSSQYYDNYNAKLYEFVNGSWQEYPTILPLGGRIPYLTPTGKIKTLKGEIACDFDVPPQSINDTFRLELFIYDRALHQSNTISTPSFILNTP